MTHMNILDLSIRLGLYSTRWLDASAFVLMGRREGHLILWLWRMQRQEAGMCSRLASFGHVSQRQYLLSGFVGRPDSAGLAK